MKAKKEEGNTEFRLGNVQKAHDLYTEALEIDPLNKFTNSKLYFNRATVSSKVFILPFMACQYLNQNTFLKTDVRKI